jgi:hypothetical protein
MRNPSGPRPFADALTARLANGAPVNLSISHTSRLRENRITVAGSEHTVTTDGFSFMESDNAAFAWRGDEQESYESAVEFQTAPFGSLRGSTRRCPVAGYPAPDRVSDLFLELDSPA